MDKLGLFRKRDVLVLLIIAISIYITFDSNGFQYLLTNSWYRNDKNSTPWVESHIKPIISDIDGDGINEIILITQELELQVITGINHKTMDNPSEIFQPEILVSKRLVELSTEVGKRPIAMQVGYVDPYSTSSERSKVIVIATEDFTILCYDHLLNQLWIKEVAHKSHEIEGLVDNYEVYETAILLTSGRIRDHTSGTIFVGMSMRERMKDSKYRVKFEDGIDLNENTLSEHQDLNLRSKLEHFNVFALDAKSGHVIWRHDGLQHIGIEQYTKSLPHISSKFELQDLMIKSNKDSALMNWVNFRQSLLSELPHSWNQIDDTSFHLSSFVRSHIGHSDRKNAKKDTIDSKFNGKKSTRFTGFEVPGLSHSAILPHDATEHIEHPNVIVAHTSQGLEVISLGTGSSITSLSLTARKTYADLDGDGVIDGIVILESDSDVNGEVSGYSESGVEFKQCSIVALSGLPTRSQLFNGTICATRHSLQDPSLHQRSKSFNAVRSTSPIILRVIDEKTSVESKMKNVVIAINTGVITCYNGNGEFQWQVSNGPTWSIEYEYAASMAFDVDALRVNEIGNHNSLGTNILIVGEFDMAIYSSDGDLLTKTHLPQKLASKPILGDFDSDGVTDIIILSQDAVFGYRLEVIESTNGMLIAIVILSFVALITFVANIRTDMTLNTKSTDRMSNANKQRMIAIIRSTDNLHVD